MPFSFISIFCHFQLLHITTFFFFFSLSPFLTANFRFGFVFVSLLFYLFHLSSLIISLPYLPSLPLYFLPSPLISSLSLFFFPYSLSLRLCTISYSSLSLFPLFLTLLSISSPPLLYSSPPSDLFPRSFYYLLIPSSLVHQCCHLFTVRIHNDVGKVIVLLWVSGKLGNVAFLFRRWDLEYLASYE